MRPKTANSHGGLCFCSCSTTCIWITTSRASQHISSWPCRHILVHQAATPNYCWDTTACHGHQAGASYLSFKLPPSSEWSRQGKDWKSVIKCVSASPVARDHGYMPKERKGALMHWKNSPEAQRSWNYSRSRSVCTLVFNVLPKYVVQPLVRKSSWFKKFI